MAQLIVRNLEAQVVQELRKRAAKSGRSMEAEHRLLLREVLRVGDKTRSLKDLLLEIPAAGRDADFVRQRLKPRRVRV